MSAPTTELKSRWVSEGMHYAGVACYYNSALDLPQGPNDNAVLTIYLRINLVPMSAAARGGFYTGTVHACLKDEAQQVQLGIRMPLLEWTDTEWMLFREQCRYQAKFWDGRFYLAPPLKYTGLDMRSGSHRVRPYVECRFEPVFVGAGEGPHVRYQVARLDESKRGGPAYSDPSRGVQNYTRASNEAAKGVGLPADKLAGRDDLGLLSSQSNHLKVSDRADDKGQVRKIKQRAFVHELGHALGMPHSGELFGDPVALAAAKSNSNDCSTYGLGGPFPELNNIMGAGDDVAAPNALPWQHRVVMHLKTKTRPQDWLVGVRQNGTTLAPRRL
jgi:hypothetical protein